MVENKFNVSFDDLYTAYIDCRKKKKNKCGAKKFEPNALYSLKRLQRDINKGQYRLSQSQCFIIKHPTTREVFCANFRDRIIQHFVFNELNPIINKMLIFDAANCRVGKGTDFAIKRVARFVRSATNNYTSQAYYLKMDLSGFFMRMDREFLKGKVLNIINSMYYGEYKKELDYIIRIIIDTDITKNVSRLSPLSDWDSLPSRKTLFNNNHGLPIGNLCSQLFANLYLNDFDHIMKSRHRYYSRYVDDMIVVDSNKDKLVDTLKIAKQYFPQVNMILNNKKSIISKTKYGVPFLGIKIKHYRNELGKRRIGRLYFSSSQFKTAEEAFTSSASRRGMFKNYHGKRLMFRWYRSMPNYIRDRLKLESNMHFVLFAEKENKALHRINFIA